MRLMETAAAFCIATVASALDPTASVTSHRELEVHVEIPAVGVSNASSAEAIRNHYLDTREDVPVAGQQCTPSSLWAKDVDPAEYEIGCKEVEELLRGDKTFAGNGKIRAVYIAQYKGRDVAVKTLINTLPMGEHEHWLEVVASEAVRGKPHVVDMLGFCGSTVVTEAYSKNLQHIVRHAKEPLPMGDVVSMSLEAAFGLQALHEAADAPIVHFDVKIDQLLLHDDGHMSLGDFNLAYFMGTTVDGSPCPFNKKNSERTPSPTKSPEYMARKPLTEKVDIYSLGLIFAEIASAGGSDPFVPWNGGIPSFDSTWNQGFVKVVQDMLGEVERRPSAAEVVSRLQSLQQELS